MKSEATYTQDRERDLKRSSTYDVNGKTKDKKKDSKKQGDKPESERNPFRHKGYEDPKQTNKDLVEEIADEVFNEGWI